MSNLAKDWLRTDDNCYYFGSFRISRKQYQKIRHGNWADLPSHVVSKKLERQFKNKRAVESYQVAYETVLSSKEGQFALGVAQEMLANKMIKLAKAQIVEARRIVRANKEHHE